MVRNFALVIVCAVLFQQAVSAADALPDGLFLKEAPAGAANVGDLKKTAKEGDEVVLRGQIGGRAQADDVLNPKRATMLVADMRLLPCNKNPGDNCKTPWDFCCVPENEKTANLAYVQVLDPNGKLVRATLRGNNGLDTLSVVVVKGKVSKSDGKNLIVSATGIYIEPATNK